MHTVLLNTVHYTVLPGCFACWVLTGRWASGDKLSVSATTGMDRNPVREKTKHWENHLFLILFHFCELNSKHNLFVDSLLPSERSCWRGRSTGRSFSHSRERLCPIRTAGRPSGCPVLGLQSEAHSPESSRGWMRPPPSPPSRCTPRDKLWGGHTVTISISL